MALEKLIQYYCLMIMNEENILIIVPITLLLIFLYFMGHALL